MLDKINNAPTKEEIKEFGYELVNKRLKKLSIQKEIVFNMDNIKYLISPYKDDGGYNFRNDDIIVPMGQYFNLGVITHELIHAFSSGHRNNPQTKEFLAFSKSTILNEAMTELISRNILKENNITIETVNESEEQINKYIQGLKEFTVKRVDKIRNEEIGEIKNINIRQNKRTFYFIQNTTEFINGDELYKRIDTIKESEEKFKNLSIKRNEQFTENLVDTVLLESTINEKKLELLKKGDINFIAYQDYIFLLEKIIYNFSEFYDKNPDEIFIELQKDYFNGNYKKFVNQLKEVFGEFDEKILEGDSIDNILIQFGFSENRIEKEEKKNSYFKK